MNEEVKRKWVQALRSGAYPQTKGRLRRTVKGDEQVGYCCLGVLCDLAVKEGVEVKVKMIGDGKEYDDQASVLPESVARWAGLIDPGEFTGYSANPPLPARASEEAGFAHSLAEVNDAGKSFMVIADLIEQYL